MGDFNVYIMDRRASIAYKAGLAAVCGFGLYLNSGALAGGFNPVLLSFFTIQVNYLCLIYAVIAAIACARDLRCLGPSGCTTPLPCLRGAVILASFAVFLIYQLVLIPHHFAVVSQNHFRLSNAIAHYIVPLMMVGDWALFDRKGAFRRTAPLLWTIVPLAYFAFCLIRAQTGTPLPLTGSRYPYFFIDADALGAVQILVNALIFAAFYIALGYGFYRMDRQIAKHVNR